MVKISRQYISSSAFGITAAISHVLENYGLTLDDCGFAFRDYGECSFTITIPKRVNVVRFLGLLSDFVFVGPVTRDLF